MPVIATDSALVSEARGFLRSDRAAGKNPNARTQDPDPPASRPPMGKYAHVISLGIQSTLVYRVNFVVRALFGLVPLLALILLWRAIYEGRTDGEVGGYSQSSVITYYLIVNVVLALTSVTEDDWQIAADIRDGKISQFLLKPIDYLRYRLCLFAAGRLVYTAAALIPTAVFLWAQRADLQGPASTLHLGVFAVSLVLTALLQFFISYTMALLAFWVLEVATFIFILFAFEYVAGGHLFPLDMLPAGVQTALQLTPFPYMLYFPVSVYLGRLQGAELWQGLALQGFWVVASLTLARVVWRRGLKHYSAVGG